MVSTYLKRLFLRGIAWDATTGATTLTAQLKAVAQARLTTVSTGRILQSTSGNGAVVSYILPHGLQGISTAELAELVSFLLDLYDRAVVALGGTPTDSQILAEMLDHLRPVRTVRSDFSSLATA